MALGGSGNSLAMQNSLLCFFLYDELLKRVVFRRKGRFAVEGFLTRLAEKGRFDVQGPPAPEFCQQTG